MAGTDINERHTVRIEVDCSDLIAVMSEAQAVIENCGIPMAARVKFANKITRLFNSGKAFRMVRSDAPSVVIRFKPSDKLFVAFDKIEAAR